VVERLEPRRRVRVPEQPSHVSTPGRASATPYAASPTAIGRVAFYSERMGPSLNVDVWLQQQGWTRIAPTGKVLGDVEVVYQRSDGHTVSARGSLNAAVCRVALKAKAQTPLLARPLL
jgi:hypothetical protein